MLEIIFALLEAPRTIFGVVLGDPMIKFARDAADGPFVPNVRRAQSAGSHPAKIISELGDNRGFSHATGLHRGGHASHRTAIDANVGLNCLSRIHPASISDAH